MPLGHDPGFVIRIEVGRHEQQNCERLIFLQCEPTVDKV